jgi:hypothetical protein
LLAAGVIIPQNTFGEGLKFGVGARNRRIEMKTRKAETDAKTRKASKSLKTAQESGGYWTGGPLKSVYVAYSRATGLPAQSKFDSYAFRMVSDLYAVYPKSEWRAVRYTLTTISTPGGK